MQIVIFAFEKFLGKFCDDVRIVVFARKDVQIHRVRRIREVCRDEGCFDELRHRITRHPFVFAEIDNDAFTETLISMRSHNSTTNCLILSAERMVSASHPWMSMAECKPHASTRLYSCRIAASADVVFIYDVYLVRGKITIF